MYIENTMTKPQPKLSIDDQNNYVILFVKNIVKCNLFQKRAKFTCHYKISRLTNNSILWESKFNNDDSMIFKEIQELQNGIAVGGPVYKIKNNDGHSTLSFYIPKDIREYEFCISYEKDISIGSTRNSKHDLFYHTFFSYASFCKDFIFELSFTQKKTSLQSIMAPFHYKISEEGVITFHGNNIDPLTYIPITTYINVGNFRIKDALGKLVWTVAGAIIGTVINFLLI